MIAGILVLYSPEYCERSLSTLRRMLQRIDEDVLLIAVCNRPGLPVSPGQGIEIIQGNNVLQEFGGWDLGIARFRQMTGSQSPDLFVFANDTFCHHRPFSWMEEHIFSAVFRQASRRQNTITGELSTFAREFSLDGPRMDAWISTYLYAMTPSLLEALNWRTTIDEQTLERLVHGGMDEKAFFSPELDPVLAGHLSGWLFASREKRIWRNAGPLSPDNADRMYQKARSILCEKYLTARCMATGAEFLDPYASAKGRLVKAFRYFQRSLGVGRHRPK